MLRRDAYLIGTTKNYYKYSYATGSQDGFVFYISKDEFVLSEPPKKATLTFEAA
jgi:hypothetical protein